MFGRPTGGRGRTWVSVAAIVPVLAAAVLQPAAARAAPATAQEGAVTVQDVLRTNNDARLVAPNAVQLEPGIILIPPPPGRHVEPWCPYEHLCVYEHSFDDSRGHGWGLALYYCNTFFNLGYRRFPDFVDVGPAAGPKWNDRISAIWNNQTPASNDALLYEWVGHWKSSLGMRAGIIVPNIGAIRLNDVIDGVRAC